MPTGIFDVPTPANEPVRGYLPGSPERSGLRAALAAARSDVPEIPVVVGGRRIATGHLVEAVAPHDHGLVVARWHQAGVAEVHAAVAAALAARRAWATMSWEARAAVFLRAADLLAGPWRARLNAVTMLGQSKNVYQAEIDAACELVDFLRFNVAYARRIHADQPSSAPGVWNRLEHRPLEGFILAVTPFNFTSIAGNLPTAPALMGNCVVWKPASSAVLPAWWILRLLEEAGLPPGVINLVPGSSSVVAPPVLTSPHLAGVHFTGSTAVFREIWRTVGEGIERYRSYPRIVGETGGKDFVLVHESADPDEVVTALVRGAFEYQGQKCSAASRAYVPASRWPEIRDRLVAAVEGIRVGDPEDFSCLVNAVIDAPAFERIGGYVDRIRANPGAGARILVGGGRCADKGWFVEPTVAVVDDPRHETMVDEIFGPVLAIHVYDERQFGETLTLVDETSPYALTGALFARDRAVVEAVLDRLRDAAGNFYVNDKPTGAVVGQQPFGGARASGTNDKAGSPLNLLRWVSPRSIKETFVPPTRIDYPYMSLAED